MHLDLDNKYQREILSRLRFLANGARYSDLKLTKIENDLFNYHLKQLVKNGFLKKEGRLYFLTEKGKSLVTNIDDQDRQLPPNYKVSVYIYPLVDGKLLLYKRLKHPQYGYTGLISGKTRFGESMFRTAQREFKEETGLTAKFELIGNLRQIRKNAEGQVIEDGIFYVFFTNRVEGKLRRKNKEGEYFWIDPKDLSKIEKLFRPSVEIIVGEVTRRMQRKFSYGDKFIYELEPEVEDY